MRGMLTGATIVLGAWAGLALAESNTSSEEIVFKFPAKVGQVTRSKVVVKNVGTIEMPGPIPDQKFSQSIEQTIAEKCTKAGEDGSAVYESGIEHIAMKTSVGGMTMDYDSNTFDPKTASNPAAKMVGLIMSQMAGAKMTIALGPDGRPTSITGLSDAMDKAVDDIGETAEVGPMKELLEKMRGMFDDEFMAQNIKAVYRRVPPKNRARVGDTWTHTWDMDIPLFGSRLEGKGEYELAGIETFRGRKCAKIRSKETYEMTSKQAEGTGAASGPGAGIFDRMNMEMSSSDGMGIVYWDYENGVLVRFRATDNMTLNISLKADPEAEDAASRRGFSMVQKLKNSVNMELLEDDEPEAAHEPQARASAPVE